MNKYGEGKGVNDIATDDTNNIYVVVYSSRVHPKAGLIYVKII